MFLRKYYNCHIFFYFLSISVSLSLALAPVMRQVSSCLLVLRTLNPFITDTKIYFTMAEIKIVTLNVQGIEQLPKRTDILEYLKQKHYQACKILILLLGQIKS